MIVGEVVWASWMLETVSAVEHRGSEEESPWVGWYYQKTGAAGSSPQILVMWRWLWRRQCWEWWTWEGSLQHWSDSCQGYTWDHSTQHHSSTPAPAVVEECWHCWDQAGVMNDDSELNWKPDQTESTPLHCDQTLTPRIFTRVTQTLILLFRT